MADNQYGGQYYKKMFCFVFKPQNTIYYKCNQTSKPYDVQYNRNNEIEYMF